MNMLPAGKAADADRRPHLVQPAMRIIIQSECWSKLADVRLDHQAEYPWSTEDVCSTGLTPVPPVTLPELVVETINWAGSDCQ